MATKSDTPSTEDTTATPVEATPITEAAPLTATVLLTNPAVTVVPEPIVPEPIVPVPVLLTPVLTLSLGGPGEVKGVITNVPLGASYSLLRTSYPGDVSLSSPLYQATTFTAAGLHKGITYTFTATALMSDVTSATSAPVTISL